MISCLPNSLKSRTEFISTEEFGTDSAIQSLRKSAVPDGLSFLPRRCVSIIPTLYPSRYKDSVLRILATAFIPAEAFFTTATGAIFAARFNNLISFSLCPVVRIRAGVQVFETYSDRVCILF